jgi:2-(1,2-epoxy-1,2-dihydrophenyl)acetyl-CoA isomerase
MTTNAAPATSELLFEVADGVAVLTFNAPDRLNAISAEMAEEAVALLTEARRRDDVRAIVLTGAGRAFCAGAHLGRPGSYTPDRHFAKQPVGTFAAFTRAIIDVDKPVIAAVRGVAVGAGLSYALACDRRFGEPSTRMSAIFIRRGLHPDCGASYFLPRLVGLSRALHMVFTGEMLDAEAAKAAGLLDELVGDGEALGAALAYAQALAKGPSVTLELARRAIHRSLSSSLDEMLYFEGFATSAVGRTSDQKEGIQAFLERREPRFIGR